MTPLVTKTSNSMVTRHTPLPLSDVYGFLESGPVTLMTTVRKDVPNVMTMSWHTMMEFEPPIIGCVVSGNDYSFRGLVQGKECVIAIPTRELMKQVVGCGNCSGRDVDKFKRYGLTAVTASKVAPPLIEECYINLECRLIDDAMVQRYNFFVLEVVQAWIDRKHKHPRTIHHLGRGEFMIAGKTIRLRSKMK